MKELPICNSLSDPQTIIGPSDGLGDNNYNGPVVHVFRRLLPQLIVSILRVLSKYFIHQHEMVPCSNSHG